MKTFLLLAACAVALARPPVAAQTATADVVVVRTYEAGGGVRVVIARGEGAPEVLDFYDYFGKTDPAKGLGAAAAVYQKVVAGLYLQGYALKSTFSPGTGGGSTLVFVKEKP